MKPYKLTPMKKPEEIKDIMEKYEQKYNTFKPQ